MPTRAMGRTLLPKRIALPVFASDALSSVAYAPDEVILTLGLVGVAASGVSLLVGLAVVVVLVVVVAAYRQTVYAYPSGGGDYEVAKHNLGSKAGLGVASALLMDYILTVAVSVSSGAHYLTTAVPSLSGYEALISLVVIVILAILNLRGMRESGRAFAIPTYIYMAAIALLGIVGLIQEATGHLGRAPTAAYDLAPAAGYSAGLVGLGGFFLVLRAFSSGCAALTGVEAISNGVPAFTKPKSKNAATTLALLGTISASMLIIILHLARRTGVKVVETGSHQLLKDGKPVSGVTTDPVIGQLAATVFAHAKPLFLLVTVVTGLILVLAANTAFNGFPQLASVLSRDKFLPAQLYNRGDRLSYSNGIVVLALAASVLIVAFDAEVTRLIQMYIVGVFISFTTSQLGMIRHWNRELRTCVDAKRRRRVRRSRLINSIGLVFTSVVLVIVTITKFTHGAWLTLLLMGIIFVLMLGINRHYSGVRKQMTIHDWDAAHVLPSRVHALVLLSKLDRPAMRAISYARLTNPSDLSLVTVEIEPGDAEKLHKQWQESGTDVALTVLDSPYRDITGPVVNHVKSLHKRSPRDVTVVYIPYFLLRHSFEHILHNHSAAKLRRELQRVPGVVVVLVPYRLHERKVVEAQSPEQSIPLWEDGPMPAMRQTTSLHTREPERRPGIQPVDETP
ncbi:MAG: APC family permease [Actinomycetaceae bacterium]|nr:APC family permease [Actinomycetaceae bacterium]MDU0969415.1 APC family permease [Actinomycetaceae bacterium]